MHLATDTAPLQVNYTPAPKPVINLSEARLVKQSFWTAYRPGLCARTLLAGIVATGSLQGLDLSQERDALEPLLLQQTQQPLRRLA
jgi:hypothetical protein